MRIVQTSFGVFHHFELARQLHRRDHLRRIYSTWPWLRLKREGLPRNLVETFPWIHTSEMLIQRIGFHHPWLLDQTSYANALAFDEWTAKRIRQIEPPDAIVALSGSSLKTGRELQARGGRFICDRGSSHQRYQERIVSEEYHPRHPPRGADLRNSRRHHRTLQVRGQIVRGERPPFQ
jgi:alpha-maltose-1-phosphate synthase